MSGSGIPWVTVENAMQALVAAQLPAQPNSGTSAIWALQSSSRLTPPFADLRWGVIKRTGYDWIDYADAPLTLTPITITGQSGNSLTAPSHGRATGDGPIQFTTTGTLPAGLSLATNYWIIVIDASTVQLAATFQDAWVPTPVTITSAGSGTIQIVSTVDTRASASPLIAKSRGMRRVALNIQIFGSVDGESHVAGAASATQLADQIIASLPRQRAALVAAGIGVLSVGPVNSTEGVVSSTILEPRATFQIIISLASQVLDPEQSIEHVGITGTADTAALPTITVDSNTPPITH